jgi:hypothetical protein
MQAKYTRLFFDEDGGSRFEDLATELQPGFCPPGMSIPGFTARILSDRWELLDWRTERLKGRRAAHSTASHDLGDDAG